MLGFASTEPTTLVCAPFVPFLKMFVTSFSFVLVQKKSGPLLASRVSRSVMLNLSGASPFLVPTSTTARFALHFGIFGSAAMLWFSDLKRNLAPSPCAAAQPISSSGDTGCKTGVLSSVWMLGALSYVINVISFNLCS